MNIEHFAFSPPRDRRGIYIFRDINSPVDPDMYFGELKFDKVFDKRVFVMFNIDGGVINRGVYDFRYNRVLYIIRGGINTYVFNNRDMRF